MACDSPGGENPGTAQGKQVRTYASLTHTPPQLKILSTMGRKRKDPPADEDDGGDNVVWEVNSRKGTSRFTSRPTPIPASRQSKNPQGFACPPQAKRAACCVPRCAPLCPAHALC